MVAHAGHHLGLSVVLHGQGGHDLAPDGASLNRVLQEVDEQLLHTLRIEREVRHFVEIGSNPELLAMDFVVEVSDRPHDDLGQRLYDAVGAFGEGIARKLVDEQRYLLEVHLAGLEKLVAKVGVVEALRDEIEERLQRR
jgi:hypothetical protein